MTWMDIMCEYGHKRFALRVPADCLDTVLPELDDAELKWLCDETMPSQISDDILKSYEYAEKLGYRPCLVIDPLMHLMSWGYADQCKDDKLPLYDFAGVLASTHHEIPVLIPNETLIAAIYEV